METCPRTAVRNAVLIDLSVNVTSEPVLDAVEWTALDSTVFATICGERMVDFGTFDAMSQTL